MVECGDGDRRAVAAGRWRDATRDSRASSAASSHDWPLGEMVAELETMAMKVEAAMAAGRRAPGGELAERKQWRGGAHLGAVLRTRQWHWSSVEEARRCRAERLGRLAASGRGDLLDGEVGAGAWRRQPERSGRRQRRSGGVAARPEWT
jgi:hypothetical protein